MTTTHDLGEALRHEHDDLLPHIEQLTAAGDAVGRIAPRAAFEFVDEAWRFLNEHLLPHARAEETGLYADVEKITGPSPAIVMMRRDHHVIESMIKKLGVLRRALADEDAMDAKLEQELHRVIYGLYALVVLHFQKEEEVLLPILGGHGHHH